MLVSRRLEDVTKDHSSEKNVNSTGVIATSFRARDS